MADPVLPPIITRDEALALGLGRYFTGEPCKHGHVAERYTKRRQCVECNHIAQISKPRKERRRADPERRRVVKREYNDNPANREKRRLREQSRRAVKTASRKARKEAAWREANPDSDETSSPENRAVIGRQEAKAAGLTRYFTGERCKHGHIAERAVAKGVCLECAKIWADADRKAKPEKHRALRRAGYALNAETRRAASAAYRAADPEKIKEQGRTRYKRNAERVSAQNSARYLLNIDKMRARSRAYREADPERYKATCKAWRKANPDKVRHQSRMNKARRRGAPGRHTRKDVAEIYALQKGKCACCRVKVGDTFHVDHIQPVAKGGSNARSNLQILCRPCNQRKKDKDPLDFSRELGLLL